jgi:hypothetical protein
MGQQRVGFEIKVANRSHRTTLASDALGSDWRSLGRVDGFDQNEAESKRDERAVILRRLLASK